MSETSVTIKYGKGYDDTWAVFRGTASEIRADIIEYFGMEPSAVAGLSLDSIVINATSLAHGKRLLATELGATVVSENPPAKPTEDPWAAAGQARTPNNASSPGAPKADDTTAYILERIEATLTVDDLKTLWADNQPLFKDAAVMAAWKAKGRILQSC